MTGWQIKPSTDLGILVKPLTFFFTAWLALSIIGRAGTITEQPNNPYLANEKADPSIAERCQLDLYLPETKQPFPMLVWFHGGGLEAGARNEEGQKAFARRLAAQGIGVAMAGYRLSPKVTYPTYVTDAAAAVKWVVDHAEALGSSPAQVYVGGHSAGGYLSALLAMDPHYLKQAGVDPAELAGFIPMSGQMMTHFTVRKERGVADSTKLAAADEAAPIFYLRQNTPPMLLILGDHDWPGRLEENQYFAAMLREVNHDGQVKLVVVPDRNHGTILSKCLEPGDPAGEAMLAFMKQRP